MARFFRLCVGLLIAGCAVSERPVFPRAVLLVEHGEPEQAAQLLTEYLARHPTALRETQLLLRAQAASGRLDRAAQTLARLRGILPVHSPIPDVEWGHVLELSHDYEAALAAYDSASARAPRDPLGPRTAGLRSARWGEWDWAEPRLQEALRRAPSDAATWHAYGWVSVRLGKLQQAQTAYESGLRADPKSAENRVGLASLALQRGETNIALKQYEQLVVERPRLADARLGQSWVLCLLGRTAEARSALSRASELGADQRALRAQSAVIERAACPPRGQKLSRD